MPSGSSQSYAGDGVSLTSSEELQQEIHVEDNSDCTEQGKIIPLLSELLEAVDSEAFEGGTF